MFLNSVADINSAVELANATTNLTNPDVFYSKQLLDTIRLDANQYCYYRYADEMPIQDKAGKLVIRRWSALKAHTIPLAEGIPPTSDKGSVKRYEMEAQQYGRYMEFTDHVDFKVVDPVVAHYAQEYSIVAIETLDLLAQKALMQVAQKWFAGNTVKGVDNEQLFYNATTSKYESRVINKITLPDGTTAMEFSTGTDGAFAAKCATGNAKPAIADFRLMGLWLKKKLVKPRANGKYHVLVSPEFVYDMLDDQYVKNYMTINQTTKSMYDDGCLIPLFGFDFYEVMNCPVSAATKLTQADKTGGVSKTGAGYAVGDWGYWSLVNSAVSTETRTVTIGTATVYVKWNPISSGAIAAGYVVDEGFANGGSYIPAHVDYDEAALANADAIKWQHVMVLGKDCLVRTGLAGEGQAKMYTKPLGSAGVLDPIDQRQSIGFKINSVGFGCVRPDAVIDYICAPTQVN